MRTLLLLACFPAGLWLWDLHYSAPEPLCTLWYVLGQTVFCVPIGYAVGRLLDT